MGKEKETALPKNIRQIGEIRGAEKICIEDYGLRFGEGDARKWEAFLARGRR